MKIWLILGAIYVGFFFWYTDMGGKLTQEEIQGFIEKQEQNILNSGVSRAVSYTHLTLPTSRSV